MFHILLKIKIFHYTNSLMYFNPPISTLYGYIDKRILELAYFVRLLICDIDGVISNNLIYVTNYGEELISFNVKDKYGINCLLKSNVNIIIITNQFYKSKMKYVKMLGITNIYQGVINKILVLKKILKKMKLKRNQVACISADCFDIPLIKSVGFSTAVADAHPLLKCKVHYVTHTAGGYGAIREICDLILLAQGKLEIVKNNNL